MEEKVLTAKNGMAVLIGCVLLYAAALAATILGAMLVQNGGGAAAVALMVLGIVWLSLGWFPLLGLKVIRPQEALVLTLFGKYIGTLKKDGFYFVNPFCTAVNPAAGTRLSQSGDIEAQSSSKLVLTTGAQNSQAMVNKKVSLKVMTLNNNRQKINDCLGNPVDISIAVVWRVVDTAKAVFDVDNYKEYLSLQCESALRNIVRA